MKDLASRNYPLTITPVKSQVLRIAICLAFLMLARQPGLFALEGGHFLDKELACKCCGKVVIHPRLLFRLELLRKALGDKPIIITSGYRCPKHNQEVGGVKNSQHTKGKAVDVKVKGLSPKEVGRIARRVGFTWIKVYSTWTHIDIR